MDPPLSLVVPEDLDGERVDKVISVLLGTSRARARELVERGARVEGSPARPSDRVRTGAVIETPAPAPAGELIPEPVGFDVIHEDDDLIVVSKPPGVVVHPGAGRAEGTLAAGLLHRYPELAGVGPPGRSGLVHRLDRDTSGVLLVARSGEAYRRLSSALARRRVGRVYQALAHGRFATPTGAIDAPVARDPSRPTRRTVAPGGRPARTHYRVDRYFPDYDLTLLELRLETGRTHQIRVHLSSIGHPVVGDRVYSGLDTRLDVPRIFLHARRVELDHPRTGERVAYESPLPDDLARVLRRLEQPGSGSEPG